MLGKLLANKPAVFIAPLHYCALQHMKISLMKSKHKTMHSNLTRGTGRTDMVVHRVATEQLFPHCAAGGIDSDLIRHLHEGLGSNVPRGEGQWTLDSRGNQMSYQCTGIKCCISGNAGLSEGETRVHWTVEQQ